MINESENTLKRLGQKRCKSRRVGGVVKAEMSGFGQGEMEGRQTRKLDFSGFFFLPYHLIELVKWWVCAWVDG